MSRTLVIYQDYTRKEIHDIFDPDTKFTPGAGTWGLHGMVKLRDSLDLVFFVTYGQKQVGHVFEENITPNGILTWQSQKDQTFDTPLTKRLINHDHLANNIHLFLRTSAGHIPYTYLGRLAYLQHDPARKKPVHFKWQILDWNLPLEKAKEIGLQYAEEEQHQFDVKKKILEDFVNLKNKEKEEEAQKRYYEDNATITRTIFSILFLILFIGGMIACLLFFAYRNEHECLATSVLQSYGGAASVNPRYSIVFDHRTLDYKIYKTLKKCRLWMKIYIKLRDIEDYADFDFPKLQLLYLLLKGADALNTAKPHECFFEQKIKRFSEGIHLVTNIHVKKDELSHAEGIIIIGKKIIFAYDARDINIEFRNINTQFLYNRSPFGSHLEYDLSIGIIPAELIYRSKSLDEFNKGIEKWQKNTKCGNKTLLQKKFSRGLKLNENESIPVSDFIVPQVKANTEYFIFLKLYVLAESFPPMEWGYMKVDTSLRSINIKGVNYNIAFP